VVEGLNATNYLATTSATIVAQLNELIALREQRQQIRALSAPEPAIRKGLAGIDSRKECPLNRSKSRPAFSRTGSCPLANAAASRVLSMSLYGCLDCDISWEPLEKDVELAATDS